MTPELANAVLSSLPGWSARLITPELILFPIRHHSPACAWHLEGLIQSSKPRSILVEGPAAFTPLIPLLLDEHAVAPFAIYTAFVDEAGLTADVEPHTPEDQPDKATRLGFGPPRYAAYYPFCDYSPELVALRAGAQTGAALRFIDLNYPDQVVAEKSGAAKRCTTRVQSLLAEPHFQRSEYLQALARRTGCRDADDLWDHLFEVRRGAISTDQFIGEVAAYCHLARLGTPPAQLEADGTLAREAAMAAAIRTELAKPPAAKAGPVLVVTGGIHTVALPEAIQKRPRPPKPLSASQAVTCLIRYGFAQLDALDGYASGMPSPYYYDLLWRETRGKRGEPFLNTATRFIVDLGRLTRQKHLAVALSPADEIAALEQARRLATLRGHAGPTREDLLDGIRSAFVKGDAHAEGEILLNLARHVLAGTGLGQVPPEAGAPPLLVDFRTTARKLRLRIDESVGRKSSLELYRNAGHRQTSRFFHRLVFLDVPFASLVGGPDFVAGEKLDLIVEHWDYEWTPETESRLVEVSLRGSTIEEAAVHCLLEAVGQLETQGKSRSATDAVRLLVQACRMGLHRHAGRLLDLVAEQVNGDPSFDSLVAAIRELVLLWQSREPLEAHGLSAVPALIGAAYRRACYLLHRLGEVPAEAQAQSLQSLLLIRELVVAQAVVPGSRELGLDPDLFWPELEQLLGQSRCPALLAGGCAGLLHAAERMSEAALLALLRGRLSAATADPAESVNFLVGLLQADRHLAWRQPALAEAVDALLRSWSDDEFVGCLPHLRLAFAGLNPRETDQVGAVVAGLHGVGDLGRLVHYELTEQDVLLAARVNQQVRAALARDGLEDWTAWPAAPAEAVGQPLPES